jgi:phosphoglycerate dehydrogenase-like enzyme
MRSIIPDPLNIVLVRKQEPDNTVERIEAIAPGRIQVSRITEQDEYTSQEQIILRGGHVAFVGAGCPVNLHTLMPSLIWVHANFAGITDLNDRDFWGTGIVMTSARGHTDLDALAEMTLVGGLAVAKDLHTAARANFDRNAGRKNIRPLLARGKTLGIVGLGGIGTTLAGLAKGMGMRVLGTKRSAVIRQIDVDGVDILYPARELHLLAAECDFLAICVPATAETYHIIDAPIFEALHDGAVLMNIARGEIVDEDAMINALDSGKLRGVYTDVYEGEQTQPPSKRLANHPHILRTPHVGSSSDRRSVNRLEVFLGNLRHLLANEPLDNIVDWALGY